MPIKIKVRGNYRKVLDNSTSKTLAPYEIDVVVDEVRPDFIQAAVQKALPAKVAGYSSLQTAYPDYESAVEVSGDGKAVKPAKVKPVKVEEAKLDEEGKPAEEQGDVAFDPDNAETLSAGGTSAAAAEDGPPAFGTGK